MYQNIPAEEKLEEILMNQLKRFEKQPALANMLFAEDYVYSNHGLKMLLYSIISTIHLYIREIGEEGQAQQEIRADVNSHHMACIFFWVR
ncbi:MAG: hypothetical protein U5L09_00870 [Bacteroidales bacterium]|nr:hypothetical protein [Bacteroidales bacterium]